MCCADLRALEYDAEADRLDSIVSASEAGATRNVAVLFQACGGRAQFLVYVVAQFEGETAAFDSNGTVFEASAHVPPSTDSEYGRRSCRGQRQSRR